MEEIKEINDIYNDSKEAVAKAKLKALGVPESFIENETSVPTLEISTYSSIGALLITLNMLMEKMTRLD
jgi:hypothetical protein